MANKKYTPIGEILSPETAMIQAALALDEVVRLAVESRDTDTILNAAMGWTQLSRLLSGESPEAQPGQRLVGFQLKEEEDGESD